jgi:hypothetical protein
MQDEAHLNKGYMKFEIIPKNGRDFVFVGRDSEVRFDNIRQGRTSGLIFYDGDGSSKCFRRVD